MNDNLKKLEKIAKVLDTYSVITTSELSGFLNDVVNVLSQYRSATGTINKETKDTLNLIVKQVNEAHQQILKDVSQKTEETAKNLKNDVYEKLNISIQEVKDLVTELKSIEITDGQDGQDGKDADEEAIYKRVLANLPVVDKDTSKEIVDKINQGNDLIDVSKIKNLPQPLIQHINHGTVGQVETRLKAGTGVTITTDPTGAKIINSTGGSTTFYTETPSGTIDGANKTYTVLNTITMIMVLAINGQFLHPTTDYTVSGNTITMVNALDSSLSGLGFTCVYN